MIYYVYGPHTKKTSQLILIHYIVYFIPAVYFITAVTYVLKMGGRKPMLNQFVMKIWQWAISKNIWLSTSHLPGQLIREADRQSRKTYSNESE